MVEILKKDGIGSALVSAAGSSIYCLGTPRGEPGWRIRVKNPGNEFQTAAEVTLKDESLSTSGSYIMDPRTGYPSQPPQGTLAVSAIAPRTLDSEVWAKPYFIPGRQWTAAHKPGNFRVFYCELSNLTKDNLTKDKADQQCAWLQ
jgi:thiamine biosynthesis lipoprotein